ncbi:hypothetical protein Tco_0747957 [Tanacetum coccineum]|uniref:Reverse transcriptase domain-containing protein n=1 Tax=Tanacetum coccineum TaxID=301880 RepID=A0ABQ4YVD9_9ASTR
MMVFHNEDGNPARANIKQALGYLKDGDGDGNSQPHKGVKASANSDVMYFFTSAQDGDPSQDDVRLCLGDDLKKAQDHSQRQATPMVVTPYKLMYRKSCHLPIELEHKAYWAIKHANFDLKTVGDHRMLQLNEINELRDQAYENSLIYKERAKKLHDSKIKNRIFNVGDQVLLFNSRLKIFSGKLKTRWLGPFTITQVFPYRTVELSQPDGPNFQVTGHCVKHYFGGDLPSKVRIFQISHEEGQNGTKMNTRWKEYEKLKPKAYPYFTDQPEPT